MKFTSEIDKAWTTVSKFDDLGVIIMGIHDNGPRDQALWRLTLTANTELLWLSG